MKTNTLVNGALDWAVAKCLDIGIEDAYFKVMAERGSFSPSTDWSRGGPLIDKYNIDVFSLNELTFKGSVAPDPDKPNYWVSQNGPTRLIAAMRCLVTSQLGHEVDIPEHLCRN